MQQQLLQREYGGGEGERKCGGEGFGILLFIPLCSVIENFNKFVIRISY